MKSLHGMNIEYESPASDIRSFAKLISHIPLTSKDLYTLKCNISAMKSFINKGADLQPELVKILCYGLEGYRANSIKLIAAKVSNIKNKGGDEEIIDKDSCFLNKSVNNINAEKPKLNKKRHQRRTHCKSRVYKRNKMPTKTQ